MQVVPLGSVTSPPPARTAQPQGVGSRQLGPVAPAAATPAGFDVRVDWGAGGGGWLAPPLTGAHVASGMSLGAAARTEPTLPLPPALPLALPALPMATSVLSPFGHLIAKGGAPGHCGSASGVSSASSNGSGGGGDAASNTAGSVSHSVAQKMKCTTPGCQRTRRSGGTPHCKVHGGGRRCSIVGCGRSAAPGPGMLCGSHGGGRRCSIVGCSKMARPGMHTPGAPLCAAHGGGKRCLRAGCDKSARAGGGQFCAGHGGGQRCKHLGCNKSAPDVTNPFCIAHGGGKRCQHPGCTRSAASGGDNAFCIRHGGGRRCSQAGCPKGAIPGANFCIAHGGLADKKNSFTRQVSVRAPSRTACCCAAQSAGAERLDGTRKEQKEIVSGARGARCGRAGGRRGGKSSAFGGNRAR